MSGNNSGPNPQAGISNHEGDNYVYGGTIDPTTTPVQAPRGSLWVRVARSISQVIGVYQKQDNGLNTNWVLLNIIFGNNFQFAQSEAISTSTLQNVWVNKLKLTTTNLPLGDYILNYQFQLNENLNPGAPFARVIQDGAITYANTVGSGLFSQLYGGHKVITNLSGIHIFDIDFGIFFGSGTATIQFARLALWRIK